MLAVRVTGLATGAMTRACAEEWDSEWCQRRLLRTIPRPIEGRDLLIALSTAVRNVTGAPVPGGFVGSCLGRNQFVEPPILIEHGLTLEQALTNIVAGFGSSVWVAVEGPAGVCALGVIHRAEGEGVCTAAITANIP